MNQSNKQKMIQDIYINYKKDVAFDKVYLLFSLVNYFYYI